MGNRYVITKDNVTPTAGNDLFTIVTTTGKRVRLLEFRIAGLGTSSAHQRVIIARSTGGTTGSSALTPVGYYSSDTPAAVLSVYTGWTTQPTRDAHGHVVAWNALGGSNVWRPLDSAGAVEARGNATLENISVYAPSGLTVQALSWSAIYDEDA